MGGEGGGDGSSKSKLTRGFQLRGIDRRTIGAVRAGGVHDPQERSTAAQGRPRGLATRRFEVDNVS